MKELEQHLNAGVRMEVGVKKKQEIEYVLEGRLCPKRGQKVWEVNEITKEAEEAKYKSDTAAFDNFTSMPVEKLIVNKDCVYIPALNVANALRKYGKNPNQSHYYVKEAPSKLSEITF